MNMKLISTAIRKPPKAEVFSQDKHLNSNSSDAFESMGVGSYNFYAKRPMMTWHERIKYSSNHKS